jgi:hypothetical protein
MTPELSGLERTLNSKIFLSNFWGRFQNGIISSDTSKQLLVNLFEPIASKYAMPIHISSVFRPPVSLLEKSVEKFSRSLFQDKNSLENLQIKHGQFNFSKPRKGFINVWYTGENIRPPLGQDWDIYLSFDSHLIDKRNFYLPFWLTGLENTVSKAQEAVDLMCLERSSKQMPSKYTSLVASNPENIRMAFVNFLKLESKIDVYGKLGTPIENKSECITEYKFNLTFENDLYPGYVTEKIFDAWLNRTIPIWRGLESEEYLNKGAFIDATNLSFPKVCEVMEEIANNVEIYDSYVKSPILKRRFDFHELINKIDKELESN